MINILIYYEHLAREWNALCRLKEILTKMGANVKICSIIYEKNKAFIWSLKHKPDVVLVPWFVDNIHEQMIYPIYRINRKVKIINLHHEQVSCAAYETVLFPKTDFTKNGSYHFTWGQYFYERLVKNGVSENKIVVTGNIRNDEALNNHLSRQYLSEVYHLNLDKKWILFAENRGWLENRNDSFTKKELMDRGMTEENVENSIKYTQKSLDSFFREMNVLDAKFFEEYEFIYRPHPGTQVLRELNTNIHVIKDESIYSWIRNCDLYLTCESTSIFEAELCKVPCATIDLEEEPENLKMVGVHEYPKLGHLKDIDEEKIKWFLECQNKNLSIYKRYLGEVDGKACVRTAKAILKIAGKTEENVYLLKNAKKTFLLKQAVYEIVTFFIVKLHMLSVLKYPRSAYIESKDIPYSNENMWIYKKDKN